MEIYTDAEILALIFMHNLAVYDLSSHCLTYSGIRHTPIHLNHHGLPILDHNHLKPELLYLLQENGII